MVEYGCNVTNKYGFMSMSDDDEFEDPQELIEKATKVEAQKAAAAKKAAAQAAAQPVVKAEPAKPTVGKENRPSGERGGRGRGGRGRGGARPPREGADVADRFGEGGRGRGGNRGRGGRPSRGRGGNTNTSDDAPKEVSFEEAPADAEGGRRGRGGRGGFGGRGGRGGRGRQFDRQSGSDRTGVRSVEKKDGHGKGNWGDASDELAGETEPVAAVEQETQEPAVPREKTAEELQYEAELAEYSKMKTLKEFKAEQKAAAAAAEFKTRKAGEGAQENFGKLVPLQKSHIDDKEEEVVIVRKESSKKVLNIDIQFTEGNRGRPDRGGPRGGRGGPRSGGRGRGGQRSHGGPAAFDAGSAEDFPALG